MKKYLANVLFSIIVTITLIYTAMTDSINLLFIVLACTAIYLNYYLFDETKAASQQI